MKKHLFLGLFALLWGLFWLPACKKDDPITTIQGRITEYGTDQPIKGARIYLLCYDGTLFGGSSSSLGDSIVTDANGEFHREYPQEDICGGSYMIVYKEGYFKRDGIGVTTGVNNVNITLDPEAWLELVTVPDLGGGGISFSGTFTGAAGWSTYPIDGIKTQYFTTTGNRIKFVDWAYWANPNATFKRDSIYLPAHDTTTYTIHY